MSQEPNIPNAQDAGEFRKRKQPGSTDSQSSEPVANKNIEKTSMDAEQARPYFKRIRSGGTEIKGEIQVATDLPPPLSKQELEYEAEGIKPILREKESRMNSAFKKLLVTLLGVGFLMIGSIVILDLILLFFVVMTWPVWAQWMIGLGLFGILAFLALRIEKSINRIRRSPLMAFDRSRKAGDLSGPDREKLQGLLLLQLEEIVKTPDGRLPELVSSCTALQAKAGTSGSGSWLHEYQTEIHQSLIKESKSKVNSLALSAGASAALSPWRALDACIALNASIECATSILKEFGVRPNNIVVLKFALDAFIATFLALGAQDVAEDFASEASEHITSELGKTVASKLTPKIAEGLTIACFVRRVGRKMLKQMEFKV